MALYCLDWFLWSKNFYYFTPSRTLTLGSFHFQKWRQSAVLWRHFCLVTGSLQAQRTTCCQTHKLFKDISPIKDSYFFYRVGVYCCSIFTLNKFFHVFTTKSSFLVSPHWTHHTIFSSLHLFSSHLIIQSW